MTFATTETVEKSTEQIYEDAAGAPMDNNLRRSSAIVYVTVLKNDIRIYNIRKTVKAISKLC